MVQWMGELARLKQSPGATPLCIWQAGHGSGLHYLGEKEVPFIGGPDVRVAQQLPGKPATGARGKHAGIN